MYAAPVNSTTINFTSGPVDSTAINFTQESPLPPVRPGDSLRRNCLPANTQRPSRSPPLPHTENPERRNTGGGPASSSAGTQAVGRRQPPADDRRQQQTNQAPRTAHSDFSQGNGEQIVHAVFRLLDRFVFGSGGPSGRAAAACPPRPPARRTTRTSKSSFPPPPPPIVRERRRRNSSLDLAKIDNGPFRRGELRVSEEIVRVEMLEDQKRAYHDILQVSRDHIRRLSSSRGEADYDIAVRMLVQLRLASNSLALLNPRLLPKPEDRRGRSPPPEALFSRQHTNDEDNDLCCICLDLGTQIRTACGHYFHQDCVDDWFHMRKFSCPMCRSPISIDDLRPATAKDDAIQRAADLTRSTLIRFDVATGLDEILSYKLMTTIELISSHLIDASKVTSGSRKSPKVIVFSSFRPVGRKSPANFTTATSDARGSGYAPPCMREGVLLASNQHGTWPYTELRNAVSQDLALCQANTRLFSQSTLQPSVLLAMPRAASAKFVRLERQPSTRRPTQDLSAASLVIFMDPWRSNKMEEIAIASVCRTGARCNVRIVRLVSRGSVEEEILKPAGGSMAANGGVLASRIILGSPQ